MGMRPSGMTPVELQENVNLQVANNLSQHPKNEHWFV